MYRTKQTVDKHVTNILSRVKDEKERNGKGYQIAKLYYEVNEYELSKRYLSGFLSINENFAPAHKLLGQILERLQEQERATEAYKRSFDLDDRQKDVLLKICELYCQTDIDPERAKYWAEKAEKHFPKNDIVFRLRERIYSEGEGKNNTDDLENLIASELVKRPDDPKLRAKLLRLYIDTGRVNEAYEHAVAVEKRAAYTESIDWYQALADVYQVYQEEGGNGNPSFHQNLLTAECALVRLHLQNGKVADCAEALHRFDQSLKTAGKQDAPGDEAATFISEMEAQMYYHAGTLLLKRAQQGHLSWAEASAMSGACFMLSYATAPFSLQLPCVVKATGDDQRALLLLHGQACIRASIAGHMLRNLSSGDGHRWQQKVRQNFLTAPGRVRIYDSLFTLRQMKGSKDSSFMMNDQKFTSLLGKLPKESDLKDFDQESHLHFGDSLHNLVWLALQYYSVKDRTQPAYGFHVFDDLQFNTASMESAAPETLSQLDTEAFLYSSVRCAAVRLEERSRVGACNQEQPHTLPPILMETLVTKEQSEWWSTAYMLYKNLAKDQLAKMRLKIQRGLENVRLVGNHGMKAALLVHLARTFEERMTEVKAKGHGPLDFAGDAADLEVRAAHYWKAAVTMLEKMKQNQGVPSPKVVLFQLEKWTMEAKEIEACIEEGKFFLACEAMNAGSYEEAIAAFAGLTSSEASYNQAQVYVQLAEDELIQASQDDELSPGGKEQYHALLVKARDALYLTLDRIRGNKHHKLTPLLPPEIEEIEMKLRSLKGDNLDEQDGSFVASPSISPPKPRALSALTHSTPGKPMSFSTPRTPDSRNTSHISPSPERLDAEIRSMKYSQDILIKHVLDRNEDLVKQNREIMDELKENRELIRKLQERLEQQEKARMEQEEKARVEQQEKARVEREEKARSESPARPAPTSASTSQHSTPRHNAAPPHHAAEVPAPPVPPPHHMYPAMPGHPPPHPYYGYPPPAPEYDYSYYQHMYPQFPYGYGSPAAAAMQHPHMIYKPPAGPTVSALNQTGGAVGSCERDDAEEDDYFTYDDEDLDEGKVGDNHQQALGRYAPRDSHHVQEWPFGNAVGIEGKSTVTYSPSQQRPIPQPGFFSQTVPGGTAPLLFSQSAASGPPMPGPGFFSSPDRAGQGFVPHYPNPGTPLNMQGQALAALQAPKPGFFSTANSNPPTTTTVASTYKFTSMSGGTQAALAGSTLYKAAEPVPVASMGGLVASSSGSFMVVSGAAQIPASVVSSVPHMVAPIPMPTSPVSPGTKPATIFPITFSTLPTPAGMVVTPMSRLTPPIVDEEDEDDGADDSYQGPDFEPIIPLPAEVEVKTGEEGEKIFFSSRAKLYRFVDKQWKERGLGEIKILFNELTGKARVVMRREQVHKVCANHSIKQDMVVEYKSENDQRVLTWKAVDFTEGEPVLEQFCVRLKSDELGIDFKKQFEAVQKLSKDSVVVKPLTPKDKSNQKQEDLFAKFKPKAGSWTCDGCYVTNDAEKDKCPACGGMKPGTKPEPSSFSISTNSSGGFTFGAPASQASAPQSTPQFGNTTVSFGNTAVPAKPADPIQPGTGFGDKFKPKSGSWTCDGCYVSNGAEVTTCVACGTQKPGTQPSKSDTPKVMSSAAGGFTFGGAAPMASTQSGFSNITLQPATQAGFSNITPQKSTASGFSTVTPKSTVTSGFTFGAQTSTAQAGFSNVSTPTVIPSTSGSSVTVSSSSAAASSTLATGVISPPKFSFTSKQSSGIPSTGTSGFNFGSTSATPAADMLKSIASKAEETSGGASKNVFGGFTFTSTPVVSENKEPERPIAHSPHSPKKTEDKTSEGKPKEGKVNPFAGFTFGHSKGTFSFGSPAGEDKKDGGAVSKPPTSTDAPKEAPKVTPSVSTDASVFGVSSSTPSFASLVSGASTEKEGFQGKTDFKGFKGTGAAVFGGKPAVSPAKGGEDGDDDHVEEYEPEVDFKPVVPLPELVEVKTGEEDEEKLFCERAKLFRYDAPSKQWKERGVGDMKILRDNETGRSRILMRRQQVLKLCANHVITADMKLNPMESSDRAWCWVAQDYAEEEMKHEKFAVKFKSPDQAEKFKEVFESSQRDIKPTLTTGEVAEGKQTGGATKPKAGWGDKFKSQSGDWECQTCYVKNPGNVTNCSACQSAKPDKAATDKPSDKAVDLSKPEKEKPKNNWGGQFKNRAGDWECQTCYVKNTGDVTRCPACQTLKPGATEDQSSEISSTTTAGSGFGSFTFGSSGSGFTFGNVSTAASSGASSSATASSSGFNFNMPVKGSGKSTAASGDTSASPFSFGSSASGSGFSFTPRSPVTAGQAAKSPQSPTSPELYQNDDEGEHIYFEPLVSLDKVDVKTGEEDEEVLYQHRAKLYRFVENEWKERGLGDVKILLHKESRKVRILMRREQILKICLNHYLTSGLELKPMANADGKAWIWHAEDYSEGVGSHEQFAIKLRSADVAEEFKAAFERGQAQTSSAGNTPVKAANTSEKSKKEIVEKQKSKDTVSSKEKDQTPAKDSAGGKTIDSFSFKPTGSMTSTPASGIVFGSPGSGAGTSSVFGTAKGFTVGTTTASDSSGPTTPTSSLVESGASPLSRGRSLLASLLEQPQQKEGDESVIVVGEDPTSPSKVEKAKELQLPEHFYNYENKEECPGCIGCDSEDHDHDVVFVKEVLPDPDKIALAEKYQLPRHFYLYENKPPCPGCRGCEDDDELADGQSKLESLIVPSGASITGGRGNPSYSKELDKAAGSQLKLESQIVPTGATITGGRGNPHYAKELDKAADGQSKLESQIVPTGASVTGGRGNPYYAKELDEASGKPTTEIVSTEASTTGDRGNPYYSAELDRASKDSETPDSTTGSGLMFGTKTDSSSSFASLAAQTPGAGFKFGQVAKGDKPFSWDGAGKSLFSQATSPGEGEDGDDVQPSPDVHFEPLVQLQEVEVKTGEEEETVLYSQRAKLYRYTNNQWKERGVGEMKLLKHKVTGRIRVLMRREQVHKLCANHGLTTEMELKPMMSSEMAWCWNALDFTEGEAKNEKFAIKFKNKDLAQAFQAKFEECQQEMSQLNESSSSIPSESATAAGDHHPAAEGETSVAPSSPEGAGDAGAEESYDEEYDTEEEDYRPLFEKRATMMYGSDGPSWQNVGMGHLLVLYDDDVNGARVSMTTDNGHTVCNHVICQEHRLQCNEAKSFCEWTAKDFSTNEPIKRTFRVQFSSASAVTEFKQIFEEGRLLARDSDIWEVTDTGGEIKVPQVAGIAQPD